MRSSRVTIFQLGLLLSLLPLLLLPLPLQQSRLLSSLLLLLVSLFALLLLLPLPLLLLLLLPLLSVSPPLLLLLPPAASAFVFPTASGHPHPPSPPLPSLAMLTQLAGVFCHVPWDTVWRHQARVKTRDVTEKKKWNTETRTRSSCHDAQPHGERYSVCIYDDDRCGGTAQTRELRCPIRRKRNEASAMCASTVAKQLQQRSILS